jgi:cyclopropane fatty-acyl-phospholipid synthase-like methyltransferase
LEYGEDYWESLDGGAGYRDSPVWEDLAHVLQEVFGHNGLRMLDIGCAAGYLVHHMRRRGTESFGCDISRYALDMAPEIVQPFLTRLDLTTPGSMGHQPQLPFELVVCLETLEHIPEDALDTCLANIARAMPETGLAFLSICLDDVPDWGSDPTHITIHSRSWWFDRLTAFGFTQHDATVRELRKYRMFRDHNGLFVVSK